MGLKMQCKRSMSVNILLFCIFVYRTAPVLSRSVRHEGYSRRTHDSPKTCKSENQFDVCKFPTDEETIEMSHGETGNKLDLEEFRSVTDDDMIKYIKRKIRAVGRKVRCKNQLKKLRDKKLKDVIKIQSSATANFNINSTITKTYLKLSTLTFVLNHLDSELSRAAKDCCLPYPSRIDLQLRNRILKTWYSIQDSYGDPIVRSQCDVCVHIDFNRSAGCDHIRDIIYLLLQHARDVLKDSQPVLKYIIRRLKRS